MRTRIVVSRLSQLRGAARYTVGAISRRLCRTVSWRSGMLIVKRSAIPAAMVTAKSPIQAIGR